MGTVISFPERVSAAQGEEAPPRAAAGSATVIILPTIRIERHTEESGTARKTLRTSANRKRRERASRS